MDNFWDYSLLNNSIKAWVTALIIIVVAIIALRLVQSIVVGRLKEFSAKSSTTLDDFAVKILQVSVMPLLYVLAIYFGLGYLKLPVPAPGVLRVAVMLATTYFVVKMITSFIAYIFTETLARKEQNTQREKQAKGILLIVQVLVWACGLLFLVDNFGYDITTLVAGLGIGGIAIALAAQTILGDLFSYLVIFFDKPFEIGDFIIVGDKMGTVQYIGIKTTRLKTLSGEQLICSNTDLTNSRVHNYKRMQERRILFGFGVVYGTSAIKMKKIPQMVKRFIESIDGLRFDRVHFKGFGSSSLDFEVVYYVLSPDYNIYMDKQQEINMLIMEAFEKEGIEFAFPTQTLYVNRVDHPVLSENNV